MSNQQTQTRSLKQVTERADVVFSACGVDAEAGTMFAEIVTRSDRDGPRGHGLRMRPAYSQSFSSDYANQNAAPKISRAKPGDLSVDAGNGYYQVANPTVRAQLKDTERENGFAALSCANRPYLGGSCFDTEPLADAGMVAFGVNNLRSRVEIYRSVRPETATNPMSFACLPKGHDPIISDQVSSMVALMGIKMTAAEGDELPVPAGFGPDGRSRADPNAVLESSSLLPFGGHKGAANTVLIVILDVALTGGAPLIAIDPTRFGNAAFDDCGTRICTGFVDKEDRCVPGDARLTERSAFTAKGSSVRQGGLDQRSGIVQGNA